MEYIVEWLSKNIIEFVAAIAGIVTVYLTIHRIVWSWAVGMVNVLLYASVFYREMLYADMGLQVLYAFLTIYGFITWYSSADTLSNRSTQSNTASKNDEHTYNRSQENLSHSILSLTATQTFSALAITGILWGAIYTLIINTTTPTPYTLIDCFLTSGSLVATWMQARKVRQCWLWWIVLDCIYVGMFMTKELYITALLYTIFVVLAWQGWRAWQIPKNNYI